jgi:hypothetical protein
VVILIITGAALVFCIFLATYEPQPSFQGRTLSAWLIAYQNDRSRSDALTAVHNIGTNALPVLVKWATYQWPMWRVRLNETAMRLGGPRLYRFVAGSSAVRQSAALVGFEILGPEAAPAIPALTNRFDWRRLYGVNDMIFLALNHMGNPGLAPLVNVATNTTVPGEMRAFAVTRIRDPLMQIDTNANWVVPVLAASLNDKAVALQIAAALGDLRLVPAVAVPALARSLQDRSDIAMTAADSLGKFGTNATAAIPDLIQALDSKDRYVRREVTNALEIIAPEVLKKDGH